MKYKVTARYTVFCNLEVDADSTSDAFEKAFATDLKDYTHSSPEDFEMKDAELLIDNFTDEQKAFIRAYELSVSDAPTKVVHEFLLTEEDDKFYDRHSEYYSGLADARGMWECAKEYFKEKK